MPRYVDAIKGRSSDPACTREEVEDVVVVAVLFELSKNAAHLC